MTLIALTRDVSPAIAQCELTHLERTPIDLEIARAQHGVYEHCLETAGCVVQRLEAGADMPDSVFIEDIAVVFDEIAVIARPGAASRRAETPPVADAVARMRPVRRIEPPGTLDGGDVLRVGRTVFVGCSGRTNSAGVGQLRCALRPLGYDVREVEVRGCLHLKSAMTAASDTVLVVNRAWIPTADLTGFEIVDVHPGEPYGANVLQVADHVIHAAAFPRTRERLEQLGIRVESVDLSELAKAEGAVTCCSILIPA
ncbi:MAG TPA: N(G),N(G)-dimethylarginine dimethylaminohydrolase [Gemmatimonadaceae bacterium]|nr:N(G),N(G)-dimethylarginine dimethylaminohydrolase [Gemmatimonadaceae bacterium]